MPPHRPSAHRNESDGKRQSSHPTEITDPLAQFHAPYINCCNDDENSENRGECNQGIVHRCPRSRRSYIDDRSKKIQKREGNEKNVSRKIGPARDKSMKVAENLFTPQIQAAFAGIRLR